VQIVLADIGPDDRTFLYATASSDLDLSACKPQHAVTRPVYLSGNKNEKVLRFRSISKKTKSELHLYIMHTQIFNISQGTNYILNFDNVFRRVIFWLLNKTIHFVDFVKDGQVHIYDIEIGD
jgi:hypothetical protein